MKKLLVILSLFLIAITNTTAQTQPGFITDSLESYISQGLTDWKIPGLAIAIVKNGKVVVTKGFGVIDIQTNEPVNENTLFMIASNSKLFTGTALAQLEYNDKLKLNDKVSKYLHGYRLYDSNATDLVTIRDMLSHRIGTKTFQGDFLFWNGKPSRQQIINKMKLLKPVSGFREAFGYCNSCFLTAGQIIPAVTKQPWEVYVYDNIVAPLGMTNTHMLTRNIEQLPNIAKPYTTQFTGRLQQLPYDNVDNIAPAGSMVSCVNDISKWLLMQLDSGKLNGRQVIEWPVIQKTREMNTVISSGKNILLPTHFTGYGLGVFMSDYNGKQVYFHTGGAFGFVTNTCFVPEENLGIVILTNNDNQNFYEALRYQILDAYLDVPYQNRSKFFITRFTDQMQKTAYNTKAMQARVKGAKPPAPLTTYTGTYTNQLYGNIIISAMGNTLTINFTQHDNLSATLKFMDNNEWLMTYSNIGYGIYPVTFIADGGKVSLEVKVNDFLEYDSYNFIKQ